MSDPAKSNDIEDVLSSIRRLVAENAKAAQDRDALVLTQDHRVSKPLTPPPAQPVVPTPQALRTEPVLTRRAEQVVQRPEPELPRVARTEPSVQPAATTDVQKTQTARPAPASEARPFPKAPPPMAETETAPQALNAGTVEQNAPVSAPSSPVFRTVTPKQDTPQQRLHTTLDIPPAPPMADLNTPLAGEFEDAIVEMTETAALEQAMAGLESAVAQSDQDWEPDDVFPTENDPAPLANSTAKMIDEGMLRDLVVETVRDELRGDLGEKITRNVRKLVRREIQRALTAQTLD